MGVWQLERWVGLLLGGVEERMAGKSKDREYEAGERIPGTEYVVIRLEARGGHGALYLVRHHFLEKKLQMLKTLRAFEPNKDLIERLKREAQMLAGMDHPHIVSVVSGGLTEEAKPRPYFVMERLRGRPLAGLLPKTPEGVGLEAALRISMELAEAIDYVHREHGVVHRDIKPDNIFIQLTPNGTTTKLLDFGVLHILFLDKRQTHERAFVGTPRYASPEQLFGDRPTPQTDLYALGLVAYELLTGSHPFENCMTLAEFGKAHLDRAPPPFPERVGAPERLERLVLSMLAKKPGDRPPSAEYVRFELGQIQQRAQLGDDAFTPRDLNQTDPTPFENVLTMTRGEATDPSAPPVVSSDRTDPSTPSPRVGFPRDTEEMVHPVVPQARRAAGEKTVEDPPIGFLPTQLSPVGHAAPAATAPPISTPPAVTPETRSPVDRAAPTRSIETKLPTPKPKTDTDVITALVQAARNEEPAKPPSPATAPVTTSAPSAVALRSASRPAARKEGIVRATLAGALVGMGLVTLWALSSRPPAAATASTDPTTPAPPSSSARVPSEEATTRVAAPASASSPVATVPATIESVVVPALAPSSSARPQSGLPSAPSRPPKDDIVRSMEPTPSPEPAHAPASASAPPHETKHPLPGSGL